MADAMELPEVRWLAMTTVGRMDVALKRSADARSPSTPPSRRRRHASCSTPAARRTAAGSLPIVWRRIRNESRSRSPRRTPADAFYFAERSKARVLLDVIRGDRIPVTKAMTDAERRHEVELRTSLTSVNSELLVRRRRRCPVTSRASPPAAQARRAPDRLRRLSSRLYAAHPELRVSRARRAGHSRPLMRSSCCRGRRRRSSNSSPARSGCTRS